MSKLISSKRYVIILITVFVSSLFWSFLSTNSDQYDQTRKYITENVIVLVIDGPRMSETFGDSTLSNIPNLAGYLAPKGVLLKNFRNNGPTYTNAGHTAITTGVYQRINNAGMELPKQPSMFQYYLKEKNADKSSAWIIASKGKLSILGNTKNKGWKNQYQPSLYCGVNGSGVGYAGDDKTWSATQSILKQYHPKLVLINLLEVDVNGHANQWEGYLRAIRNTDQKAKELWDFIESDSIYKGKTSLFITNDHGRHLKGHKDGFISHGDNCEGCRSIYLIALGPDFKKSTILPNKYEQIDISRTIAEMLHYTYPISNGKVMVDLFKN